MISLSFLLLTACSGVPATPVPVGTAAVAPTAVPPSPLPITSIPLPTETPIPTATSLPTATPSPTAAPTTTPAPTTAPTLLPTATPQPTDTPAPTSSPPPLPTDTPASANIPLSEIAAHMGQEVTASGRVTAVSSFPGGFKFILDDGHGRITLLMWHDVYDEAWDAPQLNVGATVQATGEVGEFEGELQIVPNFGGDVKVITPGTPFAP
ncbi:MAG TPA: hypothetical protein EYP41_19650, partial [Anaerolineae bacterium]|nr:hypothetical protein [Anaerolineae bacterium]